VPGTIETATPRIFAEGAISTGDASCPAFSPDGRTIHFMRESTATTRYPLGYTIMQSTYADGRWSIPVVAPFSGTHLDIDPFMTRDGRQLLFGSRRPLRPGDPETSGYQMWAVTRQTNGWSEPRPFGPPVDTTVARFFSTMTATGTLYFSQRREGGATGNDIYRSRLGPGGYEPPEPVAALNSDFSDSNPLVSADESVMIFFSARPGGLGSSDLYVSQRIGGEWGAPRNLGSGVNTPHSENCPAFSPDGRQLFFARGRRRADGQIESRNIYYVSLDSVLGRAR
jgi:Tol biopolymer transport system component